MKPSHRRTLAQEAVKSRGISIRLACETYAISERCYRYRAKLSGENADIANRLIRLTHNQRNWGFGLCFLYLRNVRGYGWNHKRVYRIYRELELNLRIKPKKRLVREKPQPLDAPQAINECWSALATDLHYMRVVQQAIEQCRHQSTVVGEGACPL